MEPEEENGQELIPIEQQTLTFYGKPIIVIRLPDGRPAVVLRFLCENMGLEPRAQIRRVRLTEAIADDLAYARVQTEGGPQKMAVLVLHGAAFWLATIDPKRVKEEEARAEVRLYQREVVDLLYAWAQAPRALAGPRQLVRTGPVIQPTQPALMRPPLNGPVTMNRWPSSTAGEGRSIPASTRWNSDKPPSKVASKRLRRSAA